MSLMSYIQSKQIQNVNIVHVHLAYEELKGMFSNLSAIFSLASKDEEKYDLMIKVKNVLQEAPSKNKVRTS